MTNIDFKEWNNAFRKLKYRHDTWYIFRDFLDILAADWELIKFQEHKTEYPKGVNKDGE
jgi:hypothetical protein